MVKTKVENIDLAKYADKIDFNCCDHWRGNNKYFLGYTGFKCCKVAMCLDCEKVQYVGGRIGNMLYPFSKRLSRNRFDIIGTIEVETSF